MKPVSGSRRGLTGEMLARAEADLELQRADRVAEQRRRIERPGLGHATARQQLLDQRGLALAQLVALATAVEAADGGGIVHRAAL